MSDKIFVGLGNPGQKYEHTRHNFGFEVLDKIANSVNLNFKDTGREKVCVFNFNSQSKIYLFKPLTFMNDSGAPLSSFMHYYKISAENIFVFYDDFAIELGQYKIKMSGSSGGHNGIKSIIAHLNTQDFWRMKLGIGPKPNDIDMAAFVLSRFNTMDEAKIDFIKAKAVEFFKLACESGFQKAVSGFK